MPSIVNGLFSGRSGIASHGTAIAVIGDNISNSSTIGYKASRAEFEDLVAGGQTSGRTVGSGSSISAVSTILEQGTLEFTSRPLDLAIDGNGFFVVRNDEGSRFYTRAGNFKVDAEGYIVTQGDLKVQGFPANGNGALDALNINNVSQDSVGTSTIEIAGNLDRREGGATGAAIAAPVTTITRPGVAPASTTTYAEIASQAEYSTVVETFDSLGQSHSITFYAFKTASNTYQVRGYVNSEEVDSGATPPQGLPRLVSDTTDFFNMTFNGDGTRSNAPASGVDKTYTIAWNNGADASSIDLDMSNFTSYSSSSNIASINQDGKGVGAVTSLSIERNGSIFALLSNGQSAVIGTLGMVNFANPEGLSRIGSQLLQQSATSGEPIIGEPLSGTLGSVSSGSIELSTVDIADQFVKLITLQRGFQANSRIITTINQLLNDVIQLA